MNYIFDFDGTIADSMPAMIAVYNKNIRGNDNPLTPVEIQKLRGMPSRKALKNLGVRWWQVPKLLFIGMGDFHALLPSVKPFKGMPKLIKQLHDDGHQLFIVSSNTSDNVRLFLEANNLEQYFINIYGSARLFNKSKTIRRVIKENKLKRRQTIYIGDETRDIKASKMARIKIISVSWGLNDANILRKYKPHYMVEFPEDIMNIKPYGEIK